LLVFLRRRQLGGPRSRGDKGVVGFPQRRLGGHGGVLIRDGLERDADHVESAKHLLHDLLMRRTFTGDHNRRGGEKDAGASCANDHVRPPVTFSRWWCTRSASAWGPTNCSSYRACASNGLSASSIFLRNSSTLRLSIASAATNASRSFCFSFSK